MKHLFYSLSCICWFFVACRNDNGTRDKVFTYFDSIHIIINSPYSCYNEVKLDSVGGGISVFGVRASPSQNIIKTKKDFQIHQENDRIRIDSLIKIIKNRNPIRTGPGFDSYQYSLSIDGKPYIEIYGYDSLLNGILRTVRPYVKIDSNGQCDIFNLMK